LGPWYYATTNPVTSPAGLTKLRHDLAWDGLGLDGAFHATADPPSVRDAVFKVIVNYPMRVDVTLLEKRKVPPAERESDVAFFGYAWKQHFCEVARRVVRAGDELMVVASQIGTRERRAAFRTVVDGVVRDNLDPGVQYRIAFWPCESEAALQAADYCLWAVCRARERGDDRWLALIRPLVASDRDLLRHAHIQYY
jgi:hypothetical protein